MLGNIENFTFFYCAFLAFIAVLKKCKGIKCPKKLQNILRLSTHLIVCRFLESSKYVPF